MTPEEARSINVELVRLADAYIDEEYAHRKTKQQLTGLIALLDTALAYVQHDADCSWNLPVDVRVDQANRGLPVCTCGLDEWGEAAKQATGFYDEAL